jgi:multiple sugar transport system ATP-binding protein
MNMAEIVLRGITKRYGEHVIVDALDLHIEAGELVVLVGPSGCGKSTILRMIAGLLEPSAGQIVIGGRDVTTLAPKARDIAMVFQSYALYPNMTVRDNLGFGLRMRRVERAQRTRAIDEVAALLQIEELLERKPRELSGGQRQRVAMGRALVRKPSLFLFDEPLSNLDARLRIEMRTMIKRLHQKFGTTTVYVTHDQVEAMTLATRIAVMDRGRLQQVGKPHEVYGSPANMFVAGFMGAPSMNLIEARLAREPGRVAVQFPLGDGSPATLLLPEPGLVASYPRDEVVLGLRPEAITDGVGADPSAALQFVTSRVDVVEPAGSDTFVVTRMGRTDVVARLRADSLPQAGDSLRLAVDMAKCVLFDPVTRARL